MGKRLPDTTYAAKYPHNKVTVTESGHQFEVDDTPGASRIRQAHKSGTYFEISEDGRKVELVVSDEYHYTKGGLTLTVEKNGDIKIAGALRLVVDGDAHVEVGKNASVVCGGDMTSAVMGNMTSTVSGDMTSRVKGSMTTKVDGSLNAKVSEGVNIGSQGPIKLSAPEVDIRGGVLVNIKAPIVDVG